MIEVQQLATEYQDLRQTIETVAEIIAMFRWRALLALRYVADKEMKKVRYHDMLKDEIWEFVSMFSYRNLEDMIARAREWEIDPETMRKRKSVYALVFEGSSKKPKDFDSRSKEQLGRGRSGKCENAYDGVCRVGGFGCFRCCKTGHYTVDCTTRTTIDVSDPICFHCNQKGHKSANCPSLAGGAVATPAPAILRITNSRQSKVDAPVVRSRAF